MLSCSSWQETSLKAVPTTSVITSVPEAYKQAVKTSTQKLQDTKAHDTQRTRQRLQQGSLKNKQWRSLLKRAGGARPPLTIPTIRSTSGSECVTNAEKAECFGELFLSKCSLGDQYLMPSDLPTLRPRCSSSLSHIHFRPSTVERHLRQLDHSNATGPHNISGGVLKACASSLLHPLSHLFTLTFRTQTRPSLWKTANVVPIHKKQSRAQTKNHRPVSLPSIPSELMEKIVNNSIMNHLE